MDCRHTILVNNNWLYVKINTSGDFNSARDIPLKEWFQIRRYSIGFFGRKNGGRKFWINQSKSIW